MFNSQLMIILANKDKINCIFGILLGKGNVEKRCRKFPELLEIARKGRIDEEDVEKIAFLLEKIGLRVNTRELVTKLLEVKRELENKNVSEISEALAVALTVMTGIPVNPEDLKKINEMVGMINCIKPDMSVDADCLDRIEGIPSELKNAFITSIAAGSVLASTIIDED